MPEEKPAGGAKKGGLTKVGMSPPLPGGAASLPLSAALARIAF